MAERDGLMFNFDGVCGVTIQGVHWQMKFNACVEGPWPLCKRTVRPS